LGAFSLMIGIAFAHPSWTFKLIVIIVFIAISNPIGSSVIARATYKAKNIPTNLVKDDLADRGETHDNN